MKTCRSGPSPRREPTPSLFSRAFPASSTFIQEKEAPRAIELMREKKCTLIVVPLDRNDWDESHALERELQKLQTATRNAKPVLDFDPPHQGWPEVEQAIKKAAEARRAAALIPRLLA